MFYAFNLKGLKKALKIIVVPIILAVILYIGVCVLFPLENIEIIERYAEEYNLEPSMVCAVINVESHFDAGAKSPKGASGLMQIMQRTADWAAEEIGIENYEYENIFEPELNIRIGCWYLNRLMKQYDGNINLVMAAYNAGSGNVSNWLYDEKYSTDGKTLSKIPYAETEAYLKKINKNKTVYEIILKVRQYEK